MYIVKFYAVIKENWHEVFKGFFCQRIRNKRNKEFHAQQAFAI